jgi:hypothetical protein
MVIFTGCKKPQGTFFVDNATDYSVDVDWNGGSYSASAWASPSWKVDPGSDWATIYVYGYGYLDDVYCSVDDGTEDGVYVYYTKSADGTKSAPILNLKKGNKTRPHVKTDRDKTK